MRVAVTGIVLVVVASAVGAAPAAASWSPARATATAAPGSVSAPVADPGRTPGVESIATAPADRPEATTPMSADVTAAEGDLHQRIRFELTPQEPGSVTVTVTYDPSSDVRQFVTAPVEGAQVRSVDGLVRNEEDNGWRYEWDGTTPEPTITYTVGNSTRSNWGLDAVDVGDWALVKPDPPRAAFYSRSDEQWVYSYEDPDDRITAETSASTDYHFAGRYLFLGDHEVRRVSRDGVTVTAVVPGAADLAVPAADTIDLVFHASRLDVGARDESVTMFYAPTPLAQFGLSDGDAAFWVGATRSDSIYIHEYVHTRQDYTPAPSMEWFDEASADYFEFRLYLETNESTYDGFYRTMNRSVEGVVLSNPETYGSENIGDYVEGRRLLAALDHKIRTATDKRRSLADVVRRMNDHEDELTYDEFVAIVEDVSGENLGPWLDRYVTTDASPEVPDDPYVYTADDADVDDDGLTTVDEKREGTDPFAADTDRDGLADDREVELGANPAVPDTDADGIADGREVDLGTDPTLDDTDGDGMDDDAELSYGTDPTAADTDADGLDDGREIELGADPMAPDTDADGLDDGREDQVGTDPTAADTDGDGLDDAREVELGSDPTLTDTDDDGLDDNREVEVGTDPTAADTDDDGIDDGSEVADGTDPTDPESPGTTATPTTASGADDPTDAPTTGQGDSASGADVTDGTDDETTTDGDGGVSDGGLPAPGPVASLLAVLAGTLLLGRRRT